MFSGKVYIMKKNIYKYTRRIVIGAVGVIAAVIGVTGVAVNSGNKEDSQLSYAPAIPGAGTALFAYEGKDENILDKTYDKTGGMATVLSAYYDLNVDDNNATIDAVEHVRSFLSAEQEGNADIDNGIADAADEGTDMGETEGAGQQEDISSVIPGYTVLGVANVENYLNVRETPDIEGTLLGKLPMNAGCEILETLDGWYKISSGNVEGYVSAEYLLTGAEANARALESLALVARVNADMLMVREQPNTDCTILTRVAEGEEIEAIEQIDGWVKVNIDNVIGYVCADYVDVYETLPKGVTLKELSYGDGVNSTAVDLIEYAKQFLGNPYVYGGTSLTNGTDCSGFTMRIYEHFGYSLSRTSREQAYNGTRVSISEIQPGDLLFYSHGGTIGHVAIYIGNGQIIHASTERTGIIIGNAFYTTPTCATRIIN